MKETNQKPITYISHLFSIYKASAEYTLWPIKEERFIKILTGVGDTNTTIRIFSLGNAFILCKYKETDEENKGRIIFLFVSKKDRKKGIGTQLLEQGIEWLKSKGATEIKCGGGAGSYFWPAIPKNLDCKEFFVKNGFEVEDNGPVDMSQDITNFVVPKGVDDSLKENKVEIEFSSKEWADEILKFTKENFPNWYDYYEQHLKNEEYDKVFFAHKDKEIIGISELWIGDCNWDLLFENNVGGGGALGISEEWRGKGIGLAMKSYGTELLRDKGIKYVWIGWTYEIDFYKKLGFKVWREFLENKYVI